MIQIDNLSKAYKGHSVLKNLNISLEKNTIYTFIAPNGTGKTTLISIIAGLLLPDSGKITYSGGLSQKDTFIVLSGDKNLYVKNTVKENAYYVGITRGKSSKEIQTTINELRKNFPIYDQICDKLVEKLSFGQKRLAAMLNAIITGANCVIIDEVSEGLDIEHLSVLSRILLSLKEERIVILASHDYDFIAEISDLNCFLKDGVICEMLERTSKDILVSTYLRLYGDKED